MVLERTVVDLLDDSGDLSLVSDALGAAVKKQRLDYQRMRELLSPLAQRHGFRPHDGDTLLERLLQTAGLDLGSIAERISANSILSQHVLRSYLRREMPSFDISHTTEQATESISQTVQELSLIHI